MKSHGHTSSQCINMYNMIRNLEISRINGVYLAHLSITLCTPSIKELSLSLSLLVLPFLIVICSGHETLTLGG